jgi:CRP-like cAMP-binding protein
MKKGEIANEVFFVKSGIVEISATDPDEDDDHKISAIVEKGDCFGDEVVFAHDKHRMKYARCRTDVEVLKLKKEDLHGVLGKSGDARKLEKAVQKQSRLPFTTDY